jgi:NDP-sugar pyrophosphorylase family protein
MATMQVQSTYSAGVMAGGQGTRLFAPDGSKGFVEIGGKPLIEYVLNQFEVAGIKNIVFAGLARDHRLKDFIRTLEFSSRFETVDFLTTDSASGTGGAVRIIVEYFRGVPHVISTIDVIAPQSMTKQLLEHARVLDEQALSVVVASPLLHDLDPLWVKLSKDRRVVTAFGKDIDPTDLVFGNVRWFSGAAAEAIGTLDLSDGPYRDSLIMKKLISSYPQSVRGLEYQPVFDIDDWTDVALAEEWLRSS